MPHALTSRDSTMESKPIGSYPNTGIDVLIVGTGLAGLVAALECTRKGHNVRVLERNADINTAGDMYFMGLSATRFLKHWPELLKEYKKISLHNAWIETFKHSGEVVIGPKKVADRLRAQGLDPDTPPGEFQMRPLVYKMFVSAVENLGVSVEFNRRVVDYFEDEQTGKEVAPRTMASATRRTSSSRPTALDRRVRSLLADKEALDKDPEVKEFFKMMPGNEPIVRTWLGPSTYALTLSREDVMVWIMNHDVTGTEKESWNNTIEKEEVLDGMDKMPGMEKIKWAPIFKKLVETTPEKTIVNFELLWRNPQPSWTSPAARVVQIGDAAHSYLPASGNGATQAIEDAISIASCLQVGGKENIPQSVRVHIRFRFIRNSCAQKLGFSNAELLQDTDWDKVKLDPRRAAPKLPKWVWSHDPEAYVYENYEKSAQSLKEGIDMKDEDKFEPNYPKGYKYEPWSIEKIMEDMRAGKAIDLGAGDWE
ncbi:unnamed protein product [Alternaria alternata]